MKFLSPEQILALRSVPSLSPGAVHVWPLLLDASDESLRLCETHLAPEEIARANRFAFERLRRTFVFAHGQMRLLLGHYARATPASLEYVTGPAGKPALAPHQPFAPTLSFNLTHSADRALLAVSDGRLVGIDLERTSRNPDAMAIAGNYFFGSEFEAISRAAEARRQEEFFRYWTAKEAVLKAQGTGLSLALDAFCVTFEPDLSCAAVASFDAVRLEADWFVRALPCEPGWSAAVAARSRDWHVEIMGPQNA
jgi:4'-phosphopantetheinyl transferase